MYVGDYALDITGSQEKESRVFVDVLSNLIGALERRTAWNRREGHDFGVRIVTRGASTAVLAALI